MWRLIESYKNKQNVSDDVAMMSFDRLKAMKLLFFVASYNTNKESQGLLTIFNRFYAMPFGHVERDVYNAMRNNSDDTGNELFYKIDQKKTVKNDIKLDENQYFNNLSEKLKNQIIETTNQLVKSNGHLLTWPSLKLVNLSHEWYSWKSTFQMAQLVNRNSLPIENLVIQKEQKFYNL
jgi:hypothetical protein